ncbi:hypothetical protein WHR41_06185 [Cladosporium halotolerans]|uniref:ATP-dependent DNA helicase II subunit 2 n=1 Tax=Cladosporium halotolerans TaxID=1052096 RepID=A0AB34KJ20_9PEZI
MASKEATVYIVDVGSSMGETSSGRQETNLDFALQYVWDKITTTVATGRKTAMAGVVALRSDDTKNELEGDEAYQHISILQEISQIQMAELRRLRDELVISETDAGDAVSALIIAIQMIVRQCKQLKYIRRIVLVTDAKMHMETADLSQIAKKINDDSIELVVLGVDFDDAEYGVKEEDKDPVKANNEAILKQLCEDCNGVYGTLTQAVDELKIPRTKDTKPVPSYKGSLSLGNAEAYDTAITINIERYPKTMVAAAPSASQFVVRNDLEATQTMETTEGDEGAASSNNGLAAVHTARTYQVDDENAPGGKKDIDRDELAKGYEYGRTAVHISESDRNITTYETTQSLDVIGFVDAHKYDRYTDMSRTNVIIAERTNDKAYMALSSFIHALYELESYAVARLVTKDNKEPRILLLQPAIEPEFECLYDVELPFAEDVRSYKFPPLDKVVTVSGKELTVHRTLPSDELQDAMSEYVDSMDLSTFGKDDEGEPAEYAPLEETFSPKLHRINQVIKHRAIFPDKEPPEPYEILLRYANPPSDLVQQAAPALERVIAAADVKKVPPKARGKRQKGKEAPKPISSLDIDSLLDSGKEPGRSMERIDPKNAVPEFKRMFDKAFDNGDMDGVQNACNQLKLIIFDRVKHSVGNSGYQSALELMGAMRERCIENDVPNAYNDFARELKTRALKEELDGDRRDFMVEVRNHRMGLIVLVKDDHGGVTEEEGKEYARLKL